MTIADDLRAPGPAKATGRVAGASVEAPVCIVGMHRSGTSMVAQMLRLCGLDLGPTERLMAASPDNPDGYWEHAGFVSLDDDLLHVLGGGWDYPPTLPETWDHARFAPYRARAEALVASFAGREPWGWKDPRTSLVLPFWLDALPGLRAMTVVRNPLEVAASLRRRNGTSLAAALALWDAHYRRILAATRPAERIVTHYDAYFDDAPAELRRVLGFLGIPVSTVALARCKDLVVPELRHSRSTLRDLADAGAPSELIALYSRLCAEASRAEHAGDPAAAVTVPDPGRRPLEPVSTPAAQHSAHHAVSTADANGAARAAPPAEDPAIEVKALRAAIVVQDAKLQWLQQENRTLTEQVRDGEERWAQLEGTASWRTALALQRARRVVAPPGGRREWLWQTARRVLRLASPRAFPIPDGGVPSPGTSQGTHDQRWRREVPKA
jgi:hypothetical protein